MKSGIYQIRHVASGKVYVGSSVRIAQRWTQHRTRLKKGNHHSPLLQRAWNKYGADAFVFEVLEWAGADRLLERERFHMAGAAYNHAPVAGSTLGAKYGPMTDEHKAKIAASHIGKPCSQEHRAALSRAAKLKAPPTTEARANMARAQTGRKMAPLTPEHRAIVSAAHKGKTISEAHKQTLRAAQIGRPQSAETRAKRSAAIAAWWRLRKHGGIDPVPL